MATNATSEDRIGEYRFVRTIYPGATSIVMEVVHEPTGRRFAVKQLLASRERAPGGLLRTRPSPCPIQLMRWTAPTLTILCICGAGAPDEASLAGVMAGHGGIAAPLQFALSLLIMQVQRPLDVRRSCH